MKSLKNYMIIGIIFVSLSGTLLHFAYEWFSNNALVGLFTPINESTWEHTKLLFFPMIIYTFYLIKKIGSKYPCIGSSMITGAFTGILLIITLFYTYSGIIGFNIAFIDISIFFISVILSFILAYKLTLSCRLTSFSSLLLILMLIIIGLFIVFTIYPPVIPLFISPV